MRTIPRAILLLAPLLAASCGGGGSLDTVAPTTAPATTAPTPTTVTVPDTTTTTVPETTTTLAPTTTTPPATTTAPSLAQTITIADGYLTVLVPAGWEVTDSVDVLEQAIDRRSDVYEAGTDVSDVVAFSDGTTEVFIGREPRIHSAPPYAEWHRAFRAETIAQGIQPNIELPKDWAGGSGNRIISTAPDGSSFVIDTVGVGTERIVSATTSPDTLEGETSAAVDQILESIVIDPASVHPLTHSLDARRNAEPEDTGGTGFTASFLVPAFWSYTDTEQLVNIIDAPNGGFVTVRIVRAEPTLRAELDLELGSELGQGFFELEPVIEEMIVDEVPTIIAWEGPPETATAALVVGSDGFASSIAYLYTPDDPALLQAIVYSLLYPNHGPIG